MLFMPITVAAIMKILITSVPANIYQYSSHSFNVYCQQIKTQKANSIEHQI